MIRVLEPCQVFLNEYRSALFKGMTDIVQYDGSAAFKNIEGFVHFKCRWIGSRYRPSLAGFPWRDRAACSRPEFDEDVAVVTEMDEMFASVALITEPCDGT